MPCSTRWRTRARRVVFTKGSDACKGRTIVREAFAGTRWAGPPTASRGLRRVASDPAAGGERDRGAVADHEVVEQADVDQGEGLLQARRHRAEIGRAHV